jgi:cytochrome c oxidase subunit 3
MLLSLVALSHSPYYGPGDNPRRGRGDPTIGRFGMTLFLLALAALFAPLLVICILLRFEADNWPPTRMPELPEALWISTLLIVVVSLYMQWAVYAVRHGDTRQVRRLVAISSLVALAFLACQSFCWWTFFHHGFSPDQWRYAGFFYFFTILHALHVVGGIIPLMLTLRHSVLACFDRSRYGLLKHCAMYWHFLDGVWIVMFTAMMLPG